jgi:hypothetical protein
MKRNVLSIVLALWAMMCLLPMEATATEYHQVTAGVASGAEHGRVELYADQAAAGETVWLLAEPEAGYLVQIDGVCEAGEVWLSYTGLGMYAFDMPGGDVELQIRFVPAEGAWYGVTGTVNNPELGTLTIRREEAREGEWVAVEAAPASGCWLARLEAVGTDGLPVWGGYADTRDGVVIYEYCLPNAGIVIEAVFVREIPQGIRRGASAQMLERIPGQWEMALRFAMQY